MGIYKKVKFPIEITKGKAEDLFRLRFMRKSELEPTVRHNLKYFSCQMNRQLDIWYKEQLFTIGSLSKEQEKLNQSRVRIRLAIRQAKRHQYVRHQDEIRTKLHDIKTKMMMMKVVQKFKENVLINKAYQENSFTTNTPPKDIVDSLRIAGNRQYLHGKKPDELIKSTHEKEDVNVVSKQSTVRRNRNHKEGMIQQFQESNDTRESSCFDTTTHDDGCKDSRIVNIKVGDTGGAEADISDNSEEDELEEHAGQLNVLEKRMETIPEESKDQVELEILDVRGKMVLFF